MSEADVEREVVSADPTLSPHANQLLTDELQAALGTDRMEVPAATPSEERRAHAGPPDFGARGALASTAPALVLIGGVLLVTGVIVTLATGSLWALIGAVAVHAFVTVVVIAWAFSRVTVVEHMDPSTAARLEQEGLANPDRVLTNLVEEFSGRGEEQRTAITPGADDTDTMDESASRTLELLVLGLVAGSAIVIPLIVGGSMWLLPAIVLPLSTAWFVGQRVVVRRGAPATDTPRERADIRAAAPRRTLELAVASAIGVALFVLFTALVLSGL
jgi:hypothetical protein